MENYKTIIKNIKNLEIQGAENVAIAAIEAFEEKLKETKNKKNRDTIIRHAYAELLALRSTEPGLQNALRYCLNNYKKNKNVAQEVKKHFEKSAKKIAKIGAEKIKNGMIVFTHCHSSTVEKI